MSEHDDALAQLRQQYDRQTAAWNALKDRFAALGHDRVRVANDLLEQLSASVRIARTARSVAGVRA
jgi:hypothetical protein